MNMTEFPNEVHIFPSLFCRKSEESDYEEEEWDRHRALHNDVSARRMVDNVDDLADQPGTKDRLFEENMEVTWDKGSSGLVFYTDAQYWKEVEGQWEADDVDDWDVDTSEYDNPGSGDKDARDAADMRLSNDLRAGEGLPKSVFKRRSKNEKLGSFERHTKGIGRKLMEGSGWSDGQGLGSKGQGRPTVIDNQGQQGRFGLGFQKNSSGEPRLRHRVTKRPFYQDEDDQEVIRISTIYDNEVAGEDKNQN